MFISMSHTYNSLITYINSMYKKLCTSKKSNQCIISSKNKKIYCGEEKQFFINNNELICNKKLVTISPGGLKGFYLLGILTYLKENYKTDNLIFSGASAGSWNTLFMCYKGSQNPLNFISNFLDTNIIKAKSLKEVQYLLKYKLLTNYSSDDFDLNKIFLGVTTFKNFTPIVNIYTDFEDLEDAVNCCMASSHIPLITGGITNRYKNMFSLDGGFSNYPYLDKNNIIHISYKMWKEIKKPNNDNIFYRTINFFKSFLEIMSTSKNNLLELFNNGYNDAKLHKDYFDKLLDKKND